jgi:pyruvate dehydrogenase E1 component
MASATSLSTILTALYCDVMGPDDRLAVKVCILTHCAIVLLCYCVTLLTHCLSRVQPHASPTFHSLQYLLQNQTVEQLQQFRAYGGVQSYPSRTKDKVSS